jgi:hypothetical protein
VRDCAQRSPRARDSLGRCGESESVGEDASARCASERVVTHEKENQVARYSVPSELGDLARTGEFDRVLALVLIGDDVFELVYFALFERREI